MFWIILGHTFYYWLNTALANPLIPLDLFKSFSFNIVSSGPYAVDIFFWLSGFLGVYIMLSSAKQKRGRLQPFHMVIIHRYLRIVPLYGATLLFYWFLMTAVGTGPMFFTMYKGRAEYCESTWWIHLLFLNNFYEFNKYSNNCMGWTWYLPNDFQFFLLVPILVWLFYRKRVIGLIFVAIYQTV